MHDPTHLTVRQDWHNAPRREPVRTTTGIDKVNSAQFAQRHAELARSMPGFTGLIDAVQGLLVGWSIATAQILHTPDVRTTIELAWSIVQDLFEMTDAWGVEK
jgi:hypothetical protein